MTRDPDIDRMIQFLIDSGAAGVEHSRDSLLGHLVGTSRLLKRWGQRPAVCDAGLFHSVYGTESFDLSVLSLEFRQSLQAVIGVEAETLVYLFGIKRGEAFFDQALREAELAANSHGPAGPFAADERIFWVRHRLTGEEISIDCKQMLDLVNITLANALEQAPRLPHMYEEDERAFYRRLRPLAPPEALRDIDDVFGR